MTVDDVRGRVEAIRSTAWDFERAHSMEDDLHHDVLLAISAGHAEAAALAAAALKSRDIAFQRVSS